MAGADQMDAKSKSASQALAGVATAILIAAGTGAVGYVIGQFSEHRQSEVAAINTKIEKLYGPLYAITRANDKAWTSFSQQYWSRELQGRRGYFDDGAPPSPEQVKAWRLWIRTVFQPLNVRAEDLIVSNAQLIVGLKYPRAFDALVAHTESYKPLIAAWDVPEKDGEERSATSAQNIPLLPYPQTLSACVRDEYDALVSIRDRLEKSYVVIGHSEPQPSRSCDE